MSGPCYDYICFLWVSAERLVGKSASDLLLGAGQKQVLGWLSLL